MMSNKFVCYKGEISRHKAADLYKTIMAFDLLSAGQVASRLGLPASSPKARPDHLYYSSRAWLLAYKLGSTGLVSLAAHEVSGAREAKASRQLVGCCNTLCFRHNQRSDQCI